MKIQVSSLVEFRDQMLMVFGLLNRMKHEE